MDSRINGGRLAIDESADLACRRKALSHDNPTEPTCGGAMTYSKSMPALARIAALRSSVRSMTSEVRAALLLLLFTACGFPRPADVGDDGGTGSPGPGITIRASPSGDDANDGLTQPVKTLKHAIGLAAANTEITRIVLASGNYSMANGETFPYTVPPNVTIVGPAGGGAVLVGSGTGPGMTVDTGGLQDLDLEDFTTAIIATGTANLKNIRVLSSTLAVQAEATAKLTVNNLDITGAAGACASGIVLIGGAELTAVTLAARNLASVVDAKNQNNISVAKANITGDLNCARIGNLIQLTSVKTFNLSDGLLDGGNGIVIDSESASSQAMTIMISNTIIRNMKDSALGGRLPAGGSATFHMVGGELSNTASSASQLLTGIWTFTNVAIHHNKDFAIYLQDGSLSMRGCTISDNGGGIDIFDNATADLGTVADPGNNVFLANTAVGLSVDGNFGATQVDAGGNTWRPNVQGTDAAGRYATPATVSGPIAVVSGNNFSIGTGWSLLR